MEHSDGEVHLKLEGGAWRHLSPSTMVLSFSDRTIADEWSEDTMSDHVRCGGCVHLRTQPKEDAYAADIMRFCGKHRQMRWAEERVCLDFSPVHPKGEEK